MIENDTIDYCDINGLGKIGLAIKTVKGIWRAVNRRKAVEAAKAGKAGKDVSVKGAGASKDAKNICKSAHGNKTTRHDAHKPKQKPHYQHKNGGKGHITYQMLSSGTAVGNFGDNILSNALDLNNGAADQNANYNCKK